MYKHRSGSMTKLTKNMLLTSKIIASKAVNKLENNAMRANAISCT